MNDEQEKKQATCRDVAYEAGRHVLVNGVKNYTKPNRSPDGTKFTPLGHGVGQHIKNTQLILEAEVDGDTKNIRIGRYFKDNWGNLTEKRRDAIKKSMPRTVKVNTDGEYPSVDEGDLGLWLEKAKEESKKK